jgi:hypothetical protein
MVVSTRLKGVTSKKIMWILLENKNNTGGRTHTDWKGCQTLSKMDHNKIIRLINSKLIPSYCNNNNNATANKVYMREVRLKTWWGTYLLTCMSVYYLYLIPAWYCTQGEAFYSKVIFAINNTTCSGPPIRHPVFLPDFNKIWVFSTDFHWSLQCQISWKFVQWDMHWYMRTDMTNIMSVFCDYRDAPE